MFNINTISIMKKMMIAAICMMMISMGCMAKNNGNNNHNNNGHEPKVEMYDNCWNGNRKGYNPDMVIDMNAIHRLDLSRTQMKKVEDLNERCDKEMKKLYAKHDMKRIRMASEKYEKELKKIIGSANYKRYEFLTDCNTPAVIHGRG